MMRDPELVLEDVRNQYFSLEQAAEIYGVVIDTSQGGIDMLATRARRRSLSKKETR